MAYLVCKRFSSGPNCSDDRIEATSAEKTDCITRARLRCTSNALKCIEYKWGGFQWLKGPSIGEGCLVPGCLGDLDCYDDSCYEDIKQCFCTSLVGLICTTCDDTPTEVVPPETTDPTTDPTQQITTTVSELRPPPVTGSSWGIPIPKVFGKATVGGNIIWAGHGEKNRVETRAVSGNDVKISIVENGYIDLYVGIGAGPLARVSRVWFGTDIVVDNTDSGNTAFNRAYTDAGMEVNFYNGGESQRVNPGMTDGFGRTPAYRGLSYLEVKKFPTFVSGGSIPTIRIEVMSELDGTVTVFETSGLASSVATNAFDIDYVSGRMFVNINDNGVILNVDDFSELASFNLTADVQPTTQQLSKITADIVYQDSDKVIHFHSGYDHADHATITVAYDATYLSSIDFADPVEGQVTLVFATAGTDLYLYRLDRVTNTFTLENSFPGAAESPVITATPILATIDDTSSGTATSINLGYVDVLQEPDGLVHVRKFRMLNLYSTVSYSPSITLNSSILEPTLFGCINPLATLVHAFLVQGSGGGIFIFNDDGTIRAGLVDFKQEIPVWLTTLEDYPTTNLSARTVRRNERPYYSFIAGDDVYRMNVTTGITVPVGSLTDFGAPAIAGFQYYDSVNDFILYNDADGQITKLYPNRAVSSGATLDDIFNYVTEKAGYTFGDTFLDSLDTIPVDGFVIADQASAQAVIDELSSFYHLSNIDSAGRIAITPLSNVTEINLDNDTYQAGYAFSRNVSETDTISSVTVKYYDTDREGGVFTQTVTRDLFRPEEESLASLDEITYAASVFTTASVARRSAELYMMRSLQRQDAITLEAPVRALAFEPSDILVLSNGRKFRVNTVEIGSNLSVRLSGLTDKVEMYGTSVALDGVTVPLLTNDTADADVTIQNYPVILNVPPPHDDLLFDEVLMGQTNPDQTTFTAAPQYLWGQIRGPVPTDTPTAETVSGRLTTPPTVVTNEFSTDRRSSMVITWTKDMTGILAASTYDAMLADYTVNLLIVGDELIQFKDVALSGGGKIATFTNLFRGRFGTEKVVREHVANEFCSYYTPSRLVTVEVGTDSQGYGATRGALYYPAAPTVVRMVETPHIDFRTVGWAPTDLDIKKDAGDVTVRAYPRVPFRNTFRNSATDGDDQQDETSGRAGYVAVAFLKAAFDAQTLYDNMSLSGFNLNSDTIVTNDNAYIYRLVVIPPIRYEGETVDSSAFTFDGVDATDDMNIAIMLFNTDGTRASEATGFMFDGKVDYTNFTRGISVY